MKLQQIQEAKYYNINAAVWVQNAVDREFDMYERKGSWPIVAKTIGHQEYKFEYEKALADLTKEYGQPEEVDYHDDGKTDMIWKVSPSIAFSETDQDHYETLDVGLASDGVVAVWDITDR